MLPPAFKFLLIEFSTLFLLMLFIATSIHIDTAVLKNNLSEISVTEFSQSGFVLIAIVAFFKKIAKEPKSTGLFILISGFFTMIFIREADYYLDFVYHGFWKIPVFIVFCTSSFFAFKNKDSILPPFFAYSSTKAFTYTFIGVLMTIVFSRLFGTGSLWKDIATVDSRLVKTVVQEGLELFGYALILIGSILSHIEKPNFQEQK
jgi:hypothetical protein